MDVRILRAADRVPAAWKNGGGVTREVASWPEQAGLDGFDWRISLAEVAAGGPFSVFPGVDIVRTSTALPVASGRTVVLLVLEGRVRLGRTLLGRHDAVLINGTGGAEGASVVGEDGAYVAALITLDDISGP